MHRWIAAPVLTAVLENLLWAPCLQETRSLTIVICGSKFRQGGREGWREGGNEGGRDGGREGRREGGIGTLVVLYTVCI